MRVRRSFLYWGAFLLALGAVLLAGAANGGDAFVRDVLSLWPLVVVALGIGLLLRGTRAAWAGGMLAAAMPGLVLGSVIVAAPNLATVCGNGDAAPLAGRQGAFAGPARIDVTMSCGSLEVGTGPGMGWQLDASNSAGHTADVTASPDRLSVAAGRDGWFHAWPGRNAMQLIVPREPALDATVTVNAGTGRLGLDGARFDRLAVTANAADVHADLTGAAVGSLSAEVNAGALAITLPAADDLEGSLAVNAGALKICAPAGLGLRIHSDVTLGSAHLGNLVPSGDAWESPDYATAAHRASLSVVTNLGSFDLNPTGGCQ